jgi:TPR repeat protein
MRKRHAILPLVALSLALAQPAWARTSAEIAAIFDSGVAAYDAGDYPKAFQIWWELRFEDLAAMRNLAMMLRKGQGVERNPKQAVEIYRRAAEVGLPTAQADLADMLLKGEAGPPDLRAALPLLQAAAAANHPLAQFELGQLYETGAPPLVPQNWEVARQLYEAAASRGVVEAADRLRMVAPVGTQATAPQAAVAPPVKSAAPPPEPDPSWQAAPAAQP